MQKKSSIQTWLIAFLFMAVNILTPPGTMLEMGHQGVSLVICSKDAIQTVYLDKDGNFTPASESKTAQNNCDFTPANGQDLLCPDIFELALVPLDIVQLAPLNTQHRLAARYHLPLPRAPPQRAIFSTIL